MKLRKLTALTLALLLLSGCGAAGASGRDTEAGMSEPVLEESAPVEAPESPTLAPESPASEEAEPSSSAPAEETEEITVEITVEEFPEDLAEDDALAPEDAEEPAFVLEMLEEPREMVTTTDVNLRGEPSTEGAVLRTLPRRTTVEVTARSGDWSAVTVDRETGYIYSSYLAEPGETNGYLIAIDAGHQRRGNSDKEPVGPGSSDLKAKVTSGTSGVVSGWDEYELNLVLALKLQEELEDRGYEVIMTRTTHDVDLSNAQRAAVANDAGADAFVRIHADGSDDSSAHGAMTICQTSASPYNAALHDESYALSVAVLDALVAETGCNRRGVWETDTMSGINWCTVPVTIVEVGFMSNPAEDALLATEDYQDLVVRGIANGIDDYLQR